MSGEHRLFSSVRYIVTGEISEEVKLLLRHNGAEGYSYFSDYLTHCIVGDEPCDIDVSDAVEIYQIPAVTQEWVTFSHKCNKLLPSAFKGSCNQLFTGVVASFSKLSQEDMKKLWAMLKYYGGTHSSVLENTTTHLIVSKAEGCMYQQALKSPGKVHVVTPDWLLDSIRAGRLLDVDSYHPRLPPEKPPPNSESQNVQTTYPLMRPWELDAELNCKAIPSSKPLKEPEHAQPREFDEKYNSVFLNHLTSKTLQEPMKEQPLDPIVESNGIGVEKSETLPKAKESKQEFQTYSEFLKSRLSALYNIGNQALESSHRTYFKAYLSPKSDPIGMNSRPVKMEESISPKTTKREILNRLDENQVLIQKQHTHHQTISCGGMLHPQFHSQQKYHIPDGLQKKSVRQGERSKEKSILETQQKKKVQPKGILKKLPKFKAQPEKSLTCKVSQQYLLQQIALQRMLREAQEKTLTQSQSRQDKSLQAKISKTKVIQPEIPQKMLLQSISKKVRFNLPKTPLEEQATLQTNTQPLGGFQTNTQPLDMLQTNTQPLGLLQTDTQPSGLLQTNTQPLGLLHTNIQPLGLLHTNIQPLGLLQTNFQPLGLIQTITQPLELFQPNTQPLGLLQTNTQPLGFLQTNIQPLGPPQTNTQTPGLPQTNIQSLGLLQTNIQPLGFLQTNTQPLGFLQTNNQPLGLLQTITQPLGFLQTNNQPLGLLQTNTQPLGFLQTNTQSLGPLQENTQPLALLQTNYTQPLGLLQTNTQPPGIYQPCNSNSSLNYTASQVMLVSRHPKETLLNIIPIQQPAKECPERTPEKTLTSQHRMDHPHSCCKRTYPRLDVVRNVLSPNATSTLQSAPQPTQTATNYREDGGNPSNLSQSSGGSPWQGWDISRGSSFNGWNNSGGTPWKGWDVFGGCYIGEETDHPGPQEQSQVTECSESAPSKEIYWINDDKKKLL